MFKLNLLRSCALGAAMILVSGASRADQETCDDNPGKVQIRLTKQPDDVLAELRFSNGVQCFAFGDGTPGAEQWQLRADAAVVARNDRVVRFDRRVTAMRLSLVPKVRDGKLDRVYTPLIPFGDGSAIAIHADAIMSARWKSATEIRYVGYLPTAPGDAVGEQVYIGSSGPTYLIVGRPEVLALGQVRVIADRALPRALRDNVLRNVADALRNVSSIFPAPKALTYLITYSAPASDGAEWRGDTLPGVVRLNFMGRLWADGNVGMGDIAHFVHHETFHTVNWRVTSAPSSLLPTFLLEGGADAVAADMTLDPAGNVLRVRADAALRECGSIPGQRLVDKAAANPRWAPYRCGEAVQYLASGAAGAGASRFDVRPIWSRLLSTTSGRAYDWNDFVAAMHTGSDVRDGQTGALIKQLARGEIEWDDALRRFEKLGVLAQLDDDALHGQQISRSYAQSTLEVLLDAHCTGRRGTLYLDRNYILDAPVDSCKGIPDKLAVTKIENFDLEVHGYEAYQQVSEKCRSGGNVKLGGDGGNTFSLACNSPVKPLVLYRFAPGTR